MVVFASHQYPPTSSRQVGDVSPGRRSNRKALDPSFQYAARCESNWPPSQNFFAFSRFLAMICFIFLSFLKLNNFKVFLFSVSRERGARFRGSRAGGFISHARWIPDEANLQSIGISSLERIPCRHLGRSAVILRTLKGGGNSYRDLVFFLHCGGGRDLHFLISFQFAFLIADYIIIIIMSSFIFIFLILQGREIIMNVKINENNFKGCAKKRIYEVKE